MSEKPGTMLYFSDMEALERLGYELYGRMMFAIRRFSQTGEIPDFSDEPMLYFAWGFIEPKLRADDDRYQVQVDQRRYAVYCREQDRKKQSPATFEDWKKRYRKTTNDNENDRPITDDTGRYPKTNANPDSNPDAEADAEAEANSRADEASPAAGLIGEMIGKYGLADNGVVREALQEDLESYGEQTLRDALEEACLSDQRGRVTVKFYRAILQRFEPRQEVQAEKSPPGDSPRCSSPEKDWSKASASDSGKEVAEKEFLRSYDELCAEILMDDYDDSRSHRDAVLENYSRYGIERTEYAYRKYRIEHPNLNGEQGVEYSFIPPEAVRTILENLKPDDPLEIDDEALSKASGWMSPDEIEMYLNDLKTEQNPID